MLAIVCCSLIDCEHYQNQVKLMRMEIIDRMGLARTHREMSKRGERARERVGEQAGG